MYNLSDTTIGLIGSVFTARLVSQMNSNKVSAVFSGYGSHNTFIFDVTEHCELPFKRDRSEIGSDSVLHLVFNGFLYKEKYQ